MNKVIGSISSRLGSRARLVFGAIGLAAMAISMSGCATIISGTRQKVDVISEQEGAKVEIYNIRDKKVFESKNLPETARLKRGAGYFKSSEYSVKISREGSDTLTTTIESNVNLIPYLGNIYTGGIIGMVIVDPASGAMWKLDADILEADFDKGVINKYPRTDWYSEVMYALPIGSSQTLNVSAENGLVWNNGMFFGAVLEFYEGDGDKRGGFLLGGGFNLGYIYDLPVEDLKLVFGGAAGFWYAEDARYDYDRDDTWGNLQDLDTYSYNFLAPSIKLRWKFLELSYKGFLGLYEECIDNNGDDAKTGFGWNIHQISLGVYFEGNKRWKPKDKR